MTTTPATSTRSRAPSESWEWSIDLRDRSKRDFEYRIDVTYADGSSESGDWTPGAEGTILVGDVAREMLEIEVVPDLVDMTKWKLVIVRLEYADAENKLTLDRTLKLTGVPLASRGAALDRADQGRHQAHVHLPDPGVRPRRQQARPRTRSRPPTRCVVLEF